MRAIGILLMIAIYMLGISVIGAIPMVVVASIVSFIAPLIVETDSWDKYGLYFMLSCPAFIAICYTVLLSCSDRLLIRILKYSKELPRCSKLSKDEQKRLDKSGASGVLLESGVEIQNVLICDDNNINAYAVGSKTVIFTLGILNDKRISEDMLCGVAAREARRIFKGDTKIPRMFYAFSGIVFGVEFWAVNRINRFKPRVNSDKFSERLDWLIYAIGWTIFGAIRLLVRLLLKISNLIMLYVYRNMEFDVDEYVHKKYGDGLKKFLHVFLEMENEKMENEQETLLMKKLSKILMSKRNLLDTYTPTEKRIKALEKLDAEKNLT